MDIDWLKDFLALAAHGNFSRAAVQRHVTQPAFSRRIRALEEWLGAPLFERTAQGAVLTPAGSHFKAVATQVLDTLDRARREAQALASDRVPSLSIAATHALSFSFFPTWSQTHINLAHLGTLNLVSGHMAACERMLESDEVQLLLCHHHGAVPSRLEPQRFEHKRVGQDMLVAVSAVDAAGQPLWRLPAQGPLPTRLLSYSDQSGLGRIVSLCAVSIPGVGATETTFTSDLAMTLATMVRQGMGVAWLPLSLVADDVRSGQLVRAGAGAKDIPVDIVLVRARSLRSAAVDAVWQSVQSLG